MRDRQPAQGHVAGDLAYLMVLCLTPTIASTPRIQLDLLLLAALADGPAHGYAVIERVRARSRDELELLEGSVYPALHRLEADGLVTSCWVESGPRRKREYEITRRGRAALAHQVREWRRVANAVDSVIGASA